MTIDSARADAFDQLGKAGAISLADGQLNVCLASGSEGTEIPVIERIQLAEELTVEFRNIVYKTLGRWQKALASGESVLAQYEAGSRPDGCEIEYLRVKDHAFIASQLAAIGSIGNLPVFKQEQDVGAKLKFYVIVVTQPIGEALLLFRVYGPSRELSKSKLFLAVLTGGQYDRVREPGLLFDERIDCLYYGGYVFIANKNNFQRIFQFFELVKKSAKSALAIVKRNIPISNFDEFEQACESHLQKLAKLKNISERPYLKTLSLGKLKKVIAEFDLPIKTSKSGGVESLVFDPSDKWAILKLLDEDYLKSSLTGNKYEATGKRSIGSAATVPRVASG